MPLPAVKIDVVAQRGGLCRARTIHTGQNLMQRVHRLGILLLLVCTAIFVSIVAPWPRSRAGSAQQKTQAAPKVEANGNEGEAFRNNTLGVAYMNQQKFAEAQKYFEKA